MSMVEFTKEVSQLIESQFPAIYKEDGEDLVAFLEAYYEFLQSNDDYSYKIGRQIFDLADIDSSLEAFLVHFKNTYLAGFPYATITDKRFIIKHINEYYRTKGSERSLALLMKMLYNEEIELYYPRADILRASDSEWYKPYYLEVGRTSRNPSFLNKEITGELSGAKAFVESVVRKRIKGKEIDVLYLSSLRGQFKTGERITDDGVLENAPVIEGSMSSLEVVYGGRNNAVGDIFNVVTEEGLQGKVKVTGIVNATGRVDFSVQEKGWGYTTDEYTDVYIAKAMLFANNVGDTFIPLETIYQPIEKVSIISGTNILKASNTAIGQLIEGKTSGGALVANGVIVGIANTDANGAITTANSSTGIITIQTDLGTFTGQKSLILNSNTVGYQVNEYIDEQSTYTIDISNISGTFTSNEKVVQSIYTTYGTLVSGLTGTLTANSTTFTVSSTTGLVVGQPLVKTSGTGVFKTGTKIKKITGPTTLTLSATPLTAGAITFNATTYQVRTNYAYGQANTAASNTSILTLTGAFGTFNTTANTLIVGATSNASALPTSVNVTSQGARGVVTNVTGNTASVTVTYGAFDAGNLVRGSQTNLVYTMNSVVDGGASMVYLSGNTSANASTSTTSKNYVEGIVVGYDDQLIGVYANNITGSSFYFKANTYSTYVYTRRSELVNPPRYANGMIQDIKSEVTRIAGGKAATFEIGSIGDVETGVTLYTDIVGDKNVAGVRYSNIQINGQNSGYGLVADVTINSGGTGYANGAAVTFTGGGYAGGDPAIGATGYVLSDVSGTITSVVVDVNGVGYFGSPTITLPPNGAGTAANVSVVMDYGYGFPKNPNAEYNNVIGDVLNIAVSDLGSIGLLSKVNPGTEYTVDPFVYVENRYVSGYGRYDQIIEVANTAGSFSVGENLIQTIGGISYVKGRVKSVNVTNGLGTIYLERQTFAIAINTSYPIIGQFSGSSATVTNYSDAPNTQPIGKNGSVLGTAISASGVATGLSVISSGFGYINNGDVTLESADGTNNFIISARTKTETQGISEGYWRTNTSHLNSEKKLQDNKYYQEYSYDVMSGLSLDRYEKILKKVFHVSGTRMFGSVVKVSQIDSTLNVAESSIAKYKAANNYFDTTTGSTLIMTTSGNNLIVRTEEQV